MTGYIESFCKMEFKDIEEEVCAVCNEPPQERRWHIACSHVYCKVCIEEHLATEGYSCPDCGKEIPFLEYGFFEDFYSYTESEAEPVQKKRK